MWLNQLMKKKTYNLIIYEKYKWEQIWNIKHLITAHRKFLKIRATDKHIFKLVYMYDKNKILKFIRGISNNIVLK